MRGQKSSQLQTCPRHFRKVVIGAGAGDWTSGGWWVWIPAPRAGPQLKSIGVGLLALMICPHLTVYHLLQSAYQMPSSALCSRNFQQESREMCIMTLLPLLPPFNFCPLTRVLLTCIPAPLLSWSRLRILISPCCDVTCLRHLVNYNLNCL